MIKGTNQSTSPIHLLHRANQGVTEIFTAEIASDLTVRQMAVLSAIERAVGVSQTGIVKQTGIDRSTVAEMIGRLQKKGLLQRRRSREDARAYAIKLSDEGRRVLKKAEPLAKRVDEKILRAVDDRGSTFLENLSTLVTRLESSQKARRPSSDRANGRR